MARSGGRLDMAADDRSDTDGSDLEPTGLFRCPANTPAVLVGEGDRDHFACGCCGSPVYSICRGCGAPVSALETTVSRRGMVVDCGRCVSGNRPAWVMPDAIRKKIEDDDRRVREATAPMRQTSQRPAAGRVPPSAFRRFVSFIFRD
jgi:hypothetical protein